MRALPMADDKRVTELERAAERMLAWLAAMTFSDGAWPAVNDTTGGVAPTTRELEDYARGLQLNTGRAALGDSGYRMIASGPFELFVDAAAVQPGYQPGHAHADLGTFCLHVGGKPFIVDTGISTYAEGALRRQQRNTAAHNTFCIDGHNSSDVWKSFRTGKRACIINFYEYRNSIELVYDSQSGERYKRTFTWNDGSIIITDLLQTAGPGAGTLRLHLHPHVAITNFSDRSYKTEALEILFESGTSAGISYCQISNGFNDLKRAVCLEIAQQGETLITIFRII
jgi:hypothetical protein